MNHTVTPDPRAALIAGLRELADWYEAHPDVPLPRFPRFHYTVFADDDTAGVAEVEAVAAALGVEVEYGTHVRAGRSFAGLPFEVAYVSRAWMADHVKRWATLPAPAEVPGLGPTALAGLELEQAAIPAEAMTRLVQPEPVHDPAEVS